MKKSTVSRPSSASSPRRSGPDAVARGLDRTNGGSHEDGERQMLLAAMNAFRQGDFSVRLPAGWAGVHGKIADAFNDVLAVSERRARETARLSRQVGREGRLKQRLEQQHRQL